MPAAWKASKGGRGLGGKEKGKREGGGQSEHVKYINSYLS